MTQVWSTVNQNLICIKKKMMIMSKGKERWSDTFLRMIIEDQRNMLNDIIQNETNESGYRAKIVLLNDEGYTVPEITRETIQPS